MRPWRVVMLVIGVLLIVVGLVELWLIWLNRRMDKLHKELTGKTWKEEEQQNKEREREQKKDPHWNQWFDQPDELGRILLNCRDCRRMTLLTRSPSIESLTLHYTNDHGYSLAQAQQIVAFLVGWVKKRKEDLPHEV